MQTDIKPKNFPAQLFFRRRFSYNPCNELRLPLGKMSLHRDWLHTDGRGEPYPELARRGRVEECVGGEIYRAESAERGSVTRLIGRFFPYATYELTADRIDAGCTAGFTFGTEGGAEARIGLRRCGEQLLLCRETYLNGTPADVQTVAEIPAEQGLRLQITWQVADAFVTLIGTERRQLPVLRFPEFGDMNLESVFSAATAGLWAELSAGAVEVREVESCLDGGICQADPRPVRYEDGTPLMENGRLFITWSVRAGVGGFQSVVSWTPGLCDFRMEGALFFDYGDGRWQNDVATSLIFDRNRGTWLLWACAFHGGHYLQHAELHNDPRFGIHVIDTERMPTESGVPGEAALSDVRLWLGKYGDEDPDMIYDKETGLWYMSICRVSCVEGRDTYTYYLFTSKEPFSAYTLAGKVEDHGVTGGTLLSVGGRKYIIYGRRFDARAEYACADLADLTHPELLSCDYDDGGFRGWGTVIPVPCGNRTRWVWLTFDRDLGYKEYNWSYGNLYVYDAQ